MKRQLTIALGIASLIATALYAAHLVWRPESAGPSAGARDADAALTVGHQSQKKRRNHSQSESAAETANSTALESGMASISQHGDYDGLRTILGRVPEEDRSFLLLGDFLRVRSRLGLAYDCSQKLALVDELGNDKSGFIKTRLLKTVGWQIAENEANEVAASLDVESWSKVIMGAAEQDPSRAISLCAALVDDAKKEAGSLAAMKTWLALDSMKASSFVRDMDEGGLRDTLVMALITWLVGKDDLAAASSWVGQIHDEELRKQIVGAIETSSN